MDYFSMDKLSNMFVRPNRQIYKRSDLGPKQFVVGNKKFQCFRDDITLSVGPQTLECSLFSHFPKTQQSLITRCIVYLHCNTGCRVEGLPYVKPLLTEGYSVMLFDFLGSGVSSGQYISLGYNQTFDVHTVVDYLRRINPHMQIGLWGRSMGSIAAIRYCAQSPNIQAIVLDSPFGSLKELALHVGNEKTWLPQFVINIFLYFLDPRIRQKTGVGIEDIDSHSIINRMRVSSLFVTSDNDKVVKSSQVQNLYDQYNGPKQIMYIPQDHHQLRPPNIIKDIIEFLNTKFSRSNLNEGMLRGSLTDRMVEVEVQNQTAMTPKCSVKRILSKSGENLKNGVRKI